MTQAPSSLRLRAYQVGFGDCLLLTFAYPEPIAGGRCERHILIDFGSTRLGADSPRLAETALRLAEDCAGNLDAVVISHRHKDHLGAFGDRKALPILRRLAPGLIIRPWTERPNADDNEGEPERRLLGALGDGEREARRIVAQARRAKRGLRRFLVREAAEEVRNAEAVGALDALAGTSGEYLWAGKRTGLAKLLPGVRIDVIGPPKPHQWPAVERQAADHKEYWAVARKQVARYLSEESVAAAPGPTRWIINKLRKDESQSLLSLVRWLDDALNNTSLILLFSVGSHTLLFGGDAQIENWGWALDRKRRAGLSARLDAVDLYKVGHHGSRNGTPRSLVQRWRARGTPVLSVMSTKPGVHGHGTRKVPREPLLTALRDLGPLLRTDEMEETVLEITANLPDGAYQFRSSRPISE